MENPEHQLGSGDAPRPESLPRAEELQRILDSVHVGLALVSPAGVVTFASRGLARLLGRPTANLTGASVGELLLTAGGAGGMAIPPAWRSGATYDGSCRSSDGREIPLLIAASPYHSASGELEGYFALFVDRSQQKQADEQLARARTLEAVGRLAGGIAHGFNNMLAVIMGHSELLLDVVEPRDPLRTPLDEIRQAAARAAVLAQHLLSFSRTRMVVATALDLEETIRQQAEQLRQLLGARTELLIESDLPSAPVRMDTRQVEQLLVQLLTNARDAMPSGGKVTLRLSRAVVAPSTSLDPLLAPGSYVCLEFTDTGCGMNEDVRTRMFEPFFTTKEAGLAHGLGLATVYGIVLQNGGGLEVDSRPAAGTTVRVYLPLAPEPTPRARPSILLVEDDDYIREGLTELLEHEGYEIHTAVDGVEALNLLHVGDSAPQVIVTDLQMPRANGWVLALELRRDARWGRVPLVVVSGAHDAREAGAFLGAAASFQKPVDIPRFLDTLERLSASG
ncbi:MAG: putative Histidine kinase [Armatimonadetes bacterium]|jgi:PAS domain S-box-containing protein|nr:putative Histidine kinase [Armatimonadota bacterium]